MVKIGDTVRVDGVVAKVETMWGAGRQMAYKLSDGRVVYGLPDTSVVAAEPAKREWRKPREIERLPKDNDDFEE